MAGLMANTENTHTDYQTGTEFHLEYVLNQFVTNFLSVGLHGYFYDQIADDRPGPSTTAALDLTESQCKRPKEQVSGPRSAGQLGRE